MKISEGTINIGYVQIERYVCAPKTGILLLGNSSFSPYELGKIIGTEHDGKFALYPSHVGKIVDTVGASFILIPKHEIVAFVEPDDNEEFVPFIKYEQKKDGQEWIR